MKPHRRGFAAAREHGHLRPKPAVGAVTVRLTPASLYAYAADFLRAAKKSRLLAKPFLPAQYYLVCHALELVLEAFLSLAGQILDDSAASPFKRNLGRLLREADLLGLRDYVRLEAAMVAEIRKASLYYAEAVFEFPALAEALRGYPQKPRLDLLLAAAEELLSAVRVPCLAVS